MMPTEFMGRRFTGYRVYPVFFGGYRPTSGLASKETFDSIEKARAFGVKIINRNKDVYTKAFIQEWYEGISVLTEKVYYEWKNGRKVYWTVKEDKKSYVSRINSKTGEIIETIKKKR